VLHLGLHPVITFQYSSTTLYQFSDHIQSLFFESDNRVSPQRHHREQRRRAVVRRPVGVARRAREQQLDLRGRAVVHHNYVFL
jgi:hypothetical protein